MMNHRGKMVQHVRRDDALMRFHAVSLSDHPSIRQLVEALLFDADGKTRHRLVGQLGRYRGNGSGIDASAEESADPDIAQQVHLDSFAQERVEAVRDILFVTGRSEEHTSELQSLMRISYAVFCLKTQ